jgi:hypothetical protein
MGALCVDAVLSLVGLSAENTYHHLAQQVLAGTPISLQTAQSADDRVRSIGWWDLAAYAVTAVVFLAWFRDAYRSVERSGIKGLRWSAGWAVGWWFVPVLSLARPKSVLNDIWRGSDPRLRAGDSLSSEKPPALYAFWWGAWILGAFVAEGAATEFRTATTLSGLSSATEGLMFSDFVSLVAAVLGVAVVYSLSSRQGQRPLSATPSPTRSSMAGGCRCADASELSGNEAVAYLNHLEYVSDHGTGWLFRCPQLFVEWTAPHMPNGVTAEGFELRRQT